MIPHPLLAKIHAQTKLIDAMELVISCLSRSPTCKVSEIYDLARSMNIPISAIDQAAERFRFAIVFDGIDRHWKLSQGCMLEGAGNCDAAPSNLNDRPAPRTLTWTNAATSRIGL